MDGWMDGWMDGSMDGWIDGSMDESMDNLQFYMLFPSISVLSGHRKGDNEIMKGCVQWNPLYDRKDFRLEQVFNPGLLNQQASA